MNIFICLLRGINVSGKNTIKMDDLKRAFESLGADNVITYIQSGNVVFKHRESNSGILKEKIINQIYLDFRLRIPVMVLTAQQLQQVVDENPFAKDKSKDISFLHVTFLSEKPVADKRETILNHKSDFEDISFTDDTIYLYCPKGYGRSKLNNNFLENKLKVQATTRNWKTTVKLLEITVGQ